MRPASNGSISIRPASISARIVRSLSTTGASVVPRAGVKFPPCVPIRLVKMEDQGENTHFVKRAARPSGTTTEVVYSRSGEDVPPPASGQPAPAEPHQDLHVCDVCDSRLV